MLESRDHDWSPPRWLHWWSVGTLVLLFGLLALGAVVTSFQVGMADPIWPTRPWHLFLIDWQEPSRGFLIEHTHRLAGFAIGAMTAVLTIGLWFTEPKPVLRWIGVGAIVAVLASFGQLHGSLIRQQRLMLESGTQGPIDWTLAAGPTLVAIAGLVAVLLVSISMGGPGRGLRAAGIALLLMVMAQGILGGARVYLNAIAGTDLATIHGSFAQLVAAVLVGIVVATSRRTWPRSVDPALSRFAVLTAACVYCQVIAGAVLRHAISPLGARLHLMGAFLTLAVILLFARQLRASDTPKAIRVLRIVLHSLVGLQVMIGVEAWMMRFSGGLSAAAFQRVTVGDAMTRTAHALCGYGLFATSVAIACILCRYRPAKRSTFLPRVPHPELEAVA